MKSPSTSKNISKIDDPRQLTIFSYLEKPSPPKPYSLNIEILLRNAVSEAIRRSGKDRIDICTGIYKLTGVELPKSTLDNWSAEGRAKSSDTIDNNGNKRWGIPADLLISFCQVTGCWEPLFIVVESGNYKALKGKDIVRAELGRLQEEQKIIGKEIKELQNALVEAR